MRPGESWSSEAIAALGDIERAELEAGHDPHALRHTDPAPLIGSHSR